MKVKFIILLLSVIPFLSFADNSLTFDSIIDKEIYIADGFAGQSITLIKELNEYFIVRKRFGSGVPVIATIKYAVEFCGRNQIHFSEVLEQDGGNINNIREEFILTINEENNITLLLNGLELVTDYNF